jgi:peroxiredoxin Q/BCP
LRRDYEAFQQRATEIIVLGPEDAGAFQRYWERENLPFYGIPDPQHQVLELYGQEVSLFKLGRMPAKMLIDREGIARMVHYGGSMMDIPPNETVFKLLDELAEEH